MDNGIGNRYKYQNRLIKEGCIGWRWGGLKTKVIEKET